jgi:hypothetical protein
MDSLFQVHMLNEQGKEKAQEIANAFDQLLYRLNKVVPSSGTHYLYMREKLEVAAFYAKKSMANRPENQQ